MVRLTTELFAERPQFVNSVNMREINLRGQKIPVIENMGVTRDQFDVIDLTDNDIRKLDNFPTFSRLNTLYLHNNRIKCVVFRKTSEKWLNSAKNIEFCTIFCWKSPNFSLKFQFCQFIRVLVLFQSICTQLWLFSTEKYRKMGFPGRIR